MRSSIVGKIMILFAAMFVLLLAPIIVQSYQSFQQGRSYGEIIDNIIYANQLNQDVSERIEPIVWNIVAGKEGFDDSEIMPLVTDIRERMLEIRDNTDSAENRGVMDISLRALGILEDYLIRLRTQIIDRYPVAENEQLLEEIRICIAGINDLLLEFSFLQVNDASVLNQAMSEQSNLSFVVNMLLAAIVVLVGGFAFWYISKSLANPIGSLLDMSNKISAGDFSFEVELSASDEFNDLATSMNRMSKEIELLLKKGIEEQKQIQMMEHKLLQAQIKPHFLYNTLDAIIWAAEDGNKSDVVTLVTSLSSFFRISLSHGIDLIPITDEIEHVTNYLMIQQIRYSDILTYELDIDSHIPEKKILKLLLQPLVENALYHGIKHTRDRGKITVSIKRDGEKLRFSVTDTGIGMTPEALATLKHNIHHGTGATGYGLFNVNRRLKLYYSLQEGIEIQSEYRKGTEVSFTLEL